MNHFINRPIVLRLIALLITIVLFIQVSDSELSRAARGVVSSQDRTTIDDVPLELRYDTENFVITGAPETVSVKVSGPKSLVVSAEQLRDFQAVAEVRDPVIGEQEIPIELLNISDKLNAEPVPKTITVNVQEKVVKDFEVKADFTNVKLRAGYELTDFKLDQTKVQITGGKDVMEQITSVVALAEGKNVSEDFSQDYKVVALDAEGKPLDVSISPSVVKVSAEVKPPSKVVEITPVVSGEVKPGLVYEGIEMSETKATVYGDQNVLDKVTEIKIPINLSDFDKTTQYEVELDLPDKLRGYTPERVTVTVRFQNVVNKTISGIPIKPLNLDESKYKVTYPEGETAEVVVTGTEADLATLRPSNFSVSFDASNVTSGSQTVTLDATGPENIAVELPKKSISVLIEEIG